MVVENFGPYRGRQEVEFSRERGVYLFYGSNTRGKTTFHNAFRYALYGEIRGRRSLEDPALLANTDARKLDGYGSFKVTLEFNHEGTPYRLIRRYDEQQDPTEIALLERDGVPLSQDDSEKTLQSIAPKSVSQFFLFDGEQLRKYEDLLDEDSEDGAALEEAIERVLGLPIVDNAKADMSAVQQAVGKQLAAQYAAHTETKRMAVALNEAQDMRDNLQANCNEIVERIDTAKNRIEEVDSRLREFSKGERLLGLLDGLKDKAADGRRREEEAVLALSELSGDLWKAVLAQSATERLIAVDAEITALEAEMRHASAAVRDLAHLRAESDCPVCRQDVPEPLRSELITGLEPHASSSHQENVDARLRRVRDKRKTLQALSLENASLVVERDRNLRKLRLELQECDEEIKDHVQQLKAFGEDKLRTFTHERNELQGKVLRDEDRLKAAQTDLEEQKSEIEKIKSRARRLAVQPDATLDRKDQVSQALIALFGDAIDAYRAKLRRRVEERASDIFRGLSSEPDYKGLRITDHYGLEIIDSDDEVVRRSAGYEHLVALSLIAALQDSAAVRGPVIMDYPFGRLDAENTANVVAGLPRMARQVILLSFDSEFDRPAALQALGSNLAAEYELERVGPKHTVIKPRRTI
ncbi:AAA family ATPase [Streptomyces sp. NPDC002851]